jgi:hypothetical protein
MAAPDPYADVLDLLDALDALLSKPHAADNYSLASVTLAARTVIGAVVDRAAERGLTRRDLQWAAGELRQRAQRRGGSMINFPTRDLDDVLRCPLALGCEHCGRAGGCRVVTLATSVGVYCATLCERCAVPSANLAAPKLAPAAAVRRVGEHCEHLGITADQMADILRLEQ